MKYPIFLPKTNFLTKIKFAERPTLDTKLSIDGDFNGFYEWQKKNKNLKL